MGLIKGIHHIELITKSLHSVSEYLIKSFGFKCIASKPNKQILRSGNATFLLRSLSTSYLSNIDSVFNIVLEVSNVEDVLNNASNNNVIIIKNQERIEDSNGYVDMAQIKSCVGNVIHTIINKSHYKGEFLPGYDIDMIKYELMNDDVIKSFDHITFVVNRNSSNSVIKWYSNVFGMHRLLINKDDLMDDGFVFHHKSGGMRLKAFDYWKCDENCISNYNDTCKFVIAEEMVENGENQIRTFLREHEIPGIQHIGLLVKDIFQATEIFSMNKAQFLIPPSQYYEIISKNPKIQELNISLESLKNSGVLIDSESQLNNDDNSVKDGLLFQIFTKPIFDRNTFFLELVERRGATGFGSGNIKALWDAVDSNLLIN